MFNTEQILSICSVSKFPLPFTLEIRVFFETPNLFSSSLCAIPALATAPAN